MDRFSEAFEAARTAIQTDEFAGAVKKMQSQLKLLLASGGPDGAQAAQLDTLRTTLNAETFELISSQHLSLGKARAKPVIDAAGSAAKKQERAATVKMLRHLYKVTSAGAQQIWVYAPPSAYTKWIFDEVAGATDATLETVMEKVDPEVYTKDQRSTMASAVQHAKAVALDVVRKLGGTVDDATKAVVKRYFADENTEDDELPAIMAKLKGGYQRIADKCNGCSVIISDEPLDRNTADHWEDWAFIYTAEAMNVIYLQKAWLDKADALSPTNASPLYRCTRTIIHELSHKAVKTEDVVYGPKGLKPEGSAQLTAEYALHNADSWAYFAMDVVGELTGPDAANGTTVCSAIRRVPTHVLQTA